MERELNDYEIGRLLGVERPVLLLNQCALYDDGATGTVEFNGTEFFWKAHIIAEQELFPGTYQLEAMAQVAALFLLKKYELDDTPLIVGVDECRFYCSVTRENILKINVSVKKMSRNICIISGEILNENEKMVCSAEIKYFLKNDTKAGA